MGLRVIASRFLASLAGGVDRSVASGDVGRVILEKTEVPRSADVADGDQVGDRPSASPSGPGAPARLDDAHVCAGTSPIYRAPMARAGFLPTPADIAAMSHEERMALRGGRSTFGDFAGREGWHRGRSGDVRRTVVPPSRSPGRPTPTRADEGRTRSRESSSEPFDLDYRSIAESSDASSSAD